MNLNICHPFPIYNKLKLLMNKDKVQKLIENILDEEGKTSQKYLNPKTGNKVGYARALALGLVDTGEEKAPVPTPAAKIKKATSGAAPTKEKQWWSDFTKYKLNAYPIGIPQDQVKIDLTGDINSKAVMSWKSPATGRTVYSYTRDFLQANAAQKWKRIEKIKPTDINRIQLKANQLLTSRDPKIAQAAAIINIISQTGLRPGSVKGFQETGNRGISTLSPDNIIIDKDVIKFNFTGKSYQENTAEIKDAALANYLTGLKKQKQGETFLFDVPETTVDKVYDNMGMAKFKIKDMRTYVATNLAKQILYNHKINTALSSKDLTKEVKDILTRVFVEVSTKLNNTPTMAKTSYVHPQIIKTWLADHKIEPKKVGYNVESVIKEGVDTAAFDANYSKLENYINNTFYVYDDNHNRIIVEENTPEIGKAKYIIALYGDKVFVQPEGSLYSNRIAKVRAAEIQNELNEIVFFGKSLKEDYDSTEDDKLIAYWNSQEEKLNNYVKSKYKCYEETIDPYNLVIVWNENFKAEYDVRFNPSQEKIKVHLNTYSVKPYEEATMAPAEQKGKEIEEDLNNFMFGKSLQEDNDFMSSINGPIADSDTNDLGDDVDVYELPEWWDNPEYELVYVGNNGRV